MGIVGRFGLVFLSGMRFLLLISECTFVGT